MSKNGITIRLADISAGGMLLEEFFGIQNLASFAWGSALDKFIGTITSPSGMLLAVVKTAGVYLLVDQTGKIVGKMTGKRPGLHIPKTFHFTV